MLSSPGDTPAPPVRVSVLTCLCPPTLTDRMTTAAHAQVSLAVASAGSMFKPDAYAPIRRVQMQARFSGLLVLLACLYVGLLLGLTKYTAFEEQPDLQVQQYYQYLMHVNIMVRVIPRQWAGTSVK